MKRYLVIFITTDGEFACETVMADSFMSAHSAFMNRRLEHTEIYSISRAS